MKRSIACLLLATSAVAVPPCPAELFEDYGRFEQYGDCIGFASWTYCWDPFLTDLDSVPDSLANSIVRLRGEVIVDDQFCGQHLFFVSLVDAEIVRVFEPTDLGCGVLEGFPEEEHQGCLIWHSPVYGRLLAAYRGHAPGDTLGVIGVFDPCCVTVCMNHDACLEDWWYYPCTQPPPATESVTWGALKRLFKE